MSYNYDELVETITKNRQEYYHPKILKSGDNLVDYLQTSVETFETLSTSCPMTPLLWMQYAYDMSNLMKLLVRQGNNGHNNNDDDAAAAAAAATDAAALEARIQIMELSLNEFPGCAILHVHYLGLLSSLLSKQGENKLNQPGGSDDDKTKTKTEDEDMGEDDSQNSSNDIYDESYQQNLERFQHAVDTALAHVGRGSHRNEGGLIAKIYRYQAELAVLKSKTQGRTATVIDDGKNAAVVQSFVTRAMTPMGDANSSLSNEYEMFCQDHQISATVSALNEMEDGRRFESKMFSLFVTFEDGVDAAMDQEGVSPSNQIDLNSTEELDWKELLERNDVTCWMGFGGHQTAQAFIRYAQACVRFRSPTLSQKGDEDDDDEMEIDDQSQEVTKDPSVGFHARIRGMASDIYERGIAECPTVETIWLSYIRHLSYQISNEKKKKKETSGRPLEHSNALSKAKSVIDRAVRNCPYSLQLFQHKIRMTLLLANEGRIVLDPEEVLKIVTNEALGLGFITSPEAAIDLSLTVVDVVRKRILAILATEAGVLHPKETDTKTKGKKQNAQPDSMVLLEYDCAEEIKVSTTPPSIPDSTAKDIDEDRLEEIEDLATDLRDVYDEIDSLMRKKFANKSCMEARARLWADRAVTETVILGPLMGSLEEDGTTGAQSDKMVLEIIRCFDKATKADRPTNPTIFSSYIHAFLGSFSTVSSPVDVIKKVRQTRFLYQTALRSSGKSKNHVATNTNESDYEIEYESALRSLCHEYMEFERMFGSERSSGTAAKDIQRKLAKADRDATNGKTEDDTSMPQAEIKPNKRNRKNPEGDTSEENPAKKTKLSSDEVVAVCPPNGNSIETSSKANMKDPKKLTQYKVKVGKLEYPAHPYTVRVSFLSPETEDMDLVDCFRPKCGAVVHAKIMREKHSHLGHHQKPKSKGWGLVQFEERESVEKALALSGDVGIHEKVIKVERSHVAAAGIVPPGMHRINPKGQGKSTKRNEMRKKHQTDHIKDGDDARESNSTNETVESAKHDTKKPAAAPGASKPSVLAFRPRGVSSIAKKPKAKISISSKTAEN